MFSTTRIVIACTLLVATAAPAAAQDKPVGTIDTIGARVPEGRRLIVVDADGREFTGNFVAATPDGLDLRIAGRLKSFPAAQVWEVRKRGDGVWNGLLIGFSVTAALSALIVSDCDYCEGRWRFVFANGSRGG